MIVAALLSLVGACSFVGNFFIAGALVVAFGCATCALGVSIPVTLHAVIQHGRKGSGRGMMFKVKTAVAGSFAWGLIWWVAQEFPRLLFFRRPPHHSVPPP